jgi:choline monooxygenase
MTTTRNRTNKRTDQEIRSIRRAETLSPKYYRDQKYFDLAREQIFARSWQFALDTDQLPAMKQVVPWTFLDGFINEPLIFTRDTEDAVHCLSNVCTHRGNLLVEKACETDSIRCRYHGRRFGADGCFVSAPGFEDALDFPSEKDNLPAADQELWGNLIFVSIDPAWSFNDLVEDMTRRLHWLPFHQMKRVPDLCKDYFVDANWALYVENYLEGLHIPFVHPGLATILDTKDYRCEVDKMSSLQIGLASKAEDAFDLPPHSPEIGSLIAAYYYWLFPNMMFNFYPWGLSLNVVIPLAVNRSCIRYITYVYNQSKMQSYSHDLIEKTEYEDEAIVAQVQKGMQSRLYKHGRYSPQWEPNVHHFHTLLSSFLTE